MTLIRRYLRDVAPNLTNVAVESDGHEIRIFVQNDPHPIARCDVDDLLRLLNDSRNATEPRRCPIVMRWITRPAGGDAPAVHHEMRCSLAAPHSGDHLFVEGPTTR